MWPVPLEGPGGLEGVQIAGVDDEAGGGNPESLTPAGAAHGRVDLATAYLGLACVVPGWRGVGHIW